MSRLPGITDHRSARGVPSTSSKPKETAASQQAKKRVLEQKKQKEREYNAVWERAAEREREQERVQKEKRGEPQNLSTMNKIQVLPAPPAGNSRRKKEEQAKAPVRPEHRENGGSPTSPEAEQPTQMIQQGLHGAEEKKQQPAPVPRKKTVQQEQQQQQRREAEAEQQVELERCRQIRLRREWEMREAATLLPGYHGEGGGGQYQPPPMAKYDDDFDPFTKIKWDQIANSKDTPGIFVGHSKQNPEHLSEGMEKAIEAMIYTGYGGGSYVPHIKEMLYQKRGILNDMHYRLLVHPASCRARWQWRDQSFEVWD